MARQIQARRMQYKKKKRTSVRKVRGERGKQLTYTPYASIRGTNPKNTAVFRGIGFPDRLFTNLVYSDSFILTPSAGTITPFMVFQLNSIFDSQYALGGGQPTYYDQLALVYKRYKVLGAKITCNYSYGNTTTAGVGPAIVGIQCSDLTTLPTTDAGTLISSPNVGYDVLVVGDTPKNVVQTYSAKATYPDQDALLTATFGANPDRGWFAKVFASPQGLEVTAPINVVMMIEFNVELTDVLQVTDA